MKTSLILTACLLAGTSIHAHLGHTHQESRAQEGPTQENRWSAGRPDGHAPIGVMGEHTHAEGEWMLSYRYMWMGMEGNRKGTNSIGTDEILAPPASLDRFVVAPLEMDMHMHMFGLMYAPSDKLTLMGMLPYKRITMEHRVASVAPTRAAGLADTTFETESEGLGDLKLSGIWRAKDWNRQALLLNFGLSLPTGSIDEQDEAFVPPPTGPAIARTTLPYPMQLGSGTFDLLPGITYLGQSEDWSWGGQLRGTLRLGENEEDYRLGHEVMVTGWVAKPVREWLSLSSRLEYRRWGDIEGEDKRLTKSVSALGVSTVPTAQPDLRGGARLDLLIGANLYTKEGPVSNQRLAIEFGVPVHQDLDGPQLETDHLLTIGWQAAW